MKMAFTSATYEPAARFVGRLPWAMSFSNPAALVAITASTMPTVAQRYKDVTTDALRVVALDAPGVVYITAEYGH